MSQVAIVPVHVGVLLKGSGSEFIKMHCYTSIEIKPQFDKVKVICNNTYG